MKTIRDKQNQILAIFLTSEDYDKEKNFVTEDSQEFQLASFNLKKDEEILRHYHPEQERTIYNTSEALVLLNGKLNVSIYDANQELIKNENMENGDTCLLISGGHSIKLLEDSKFIEVKQGPYYFDADKIRF